MKAVAPIDLAIVVFGLWFDRRFSARRLLSALEMLADLPEGSTEAFLLAHGFTTAVIAGLVDMALATSTTEPIPAGGPCRPVSNR